MNQNKTKFEIIPAIDIIEGKCVRLSQGDYSQKTIYNENPVEIAKQFEAIGIERLHLVDLEGAQKGDITNLKVLEKIANLTNLIIDFGGGIKTDVAIESVFNAGASISTIGSIAFKNPELFYSWIKKYGSHKILLGADVKGETITISGWLENTELTVSEFLTQNTSHGLSQVFCTDVNKDGMLEGPSFELYKKIISEFPKLKFIASGGVSKMQDVIALQQINCDGVIIGKALYENKISITELKEFIKHAC